MDNCIPRKRLRRIIKEISEDNYVSQDALDSLTAFVNSVITEVVGRASDLTAHREAVTIKDDDIILAIEHMGLGEFVESEDV